jgi:hypothetical protein
MRAREFLKSLLEADIPAAPVAPGKFTVGIPSGRKGPEVADVQKAIIALGYPLPLHGVDGIRGPETAGAIKKFQTDNKLTAIDGDPGEETVSKINAILATKPEIAGKLTKSTMADVKGVDASSPYSAPDGPGVKDTGTADKAVKFFMSKGWSAAQAAGIVGNLQAESGTNMATNSVGDGGQAYGIAQWHPARQANFVKAFGKDIREANFEEQLAFVNWELNNTMNAVVVFIEQNEWH